MVCRNICERYRAIKNRIEVATKSKDTKGARIVAFSSSGKALDALVVRGTAVKTTQ